MTSPRMNTPRRPPVRTAFDRKVIHMIDRIRTWNDTRRARARFVNDALAAADQAHPGALDRLDGIR